jgi:hypothetical protein
MEENTTQSSGFFLTALLLIFITLKLCHVITWSWWWVLSPIWIPLLIALIPLGFVIYFYLRNNS